MQVGTLLAEGGEGRVYTVPGEPSVVYKAYRSAPPRQPLESLVGWPAAVAQTDPGLAMRVARATAWPTRVVPDATGQRAAGLIMPRAPERFTLRHRSGPTRLATLSYLTTDPAQRVAAYGLRLPEAVSAERLGLLYALARVLEAFESVSPAIAHGDLSGKNVLWSFHQAPEIFLLDCDNSERFGPMGQRLDPDPRRRAMTPNWDDPAVAASGNPGPSVDRYSLALIFLRVVGAAHYPLQRRQREGQSIIVDFEVPPSLRRTAAFVPGAPLWQLCQRGLGIADPAGRPSPAAWAGALRDALGQLARADLVAAIEEMQGDPASTHKAEPSAAVGVQRALDYPTDVPGEVIVRPVVADLRSRRFVRVRSLPVGASVDALGSAAAQSAFNPVTTAASSSPVPRQLRALTVEAVAWWVLLHRRMLRALATTGRRRRGVRRLGVCVIVDLAVMSAALFLVAMIVSPFLGI